MTSATKTLECAKILAIQEDEIEKNTILNFTVICTNEMLFLLS
jgi:hypothetical protein